MIRNYHSETPLNKTFILHATQVAAWKKSSLFIKDLSVQAVFDNTVSVNWHFKRHFEVGHTVKKNDHISCSNVFFEVMLDWIFFPPSIFKIAIITFSLKWPETVGPIA